MLAVEVRQGTLGVDGRGGGPAGNTGMAARSWGPAGNTGRGWSWLRSGRERRGSRIAVGRGRRDDKEDEENEEEEEEEEEKDEEEEEEEKRKEEETTDIKSNNPHLAGGEKTR